MNRERTRAIYLVGPEQIELREEASPAPGRGELVLAIEAATTCGTDLKVFRRGGHPRMLKVPGRFGHEMAGRVAAVGSAVTNYREGDRVVVANSASCGVCEACRRHRENLCRDLEYLNGAFGERLLVPARFVARSLHSIPAGLAPEHAALAEPLACVLHGLACCRLPTASALVLGCGPIGLLFVGALASRGVVVTAIDPHASRIAAARAFGAEHVRLLPREEPLPAELAAHFDLAIDATGALSGWHAAFVATGAGGETLLFGGLPPGEILAVDALRLHYEEISLVGAYHHTPQAFRAALALLAEGRLPAASLLDREVGLEQVGEALAAMGRREILKAVVRPVRV